MSGGGLDSLRFSQAALTLLPITTCGVGGVKKNSSEFHFFDFIVNTWRKASKYVFCMQNVFPN